MNNILLVSSSPNGMEMLGQLLKGTNYRQVSKASSGSEARRAMLEKEFDMLIINAPLSDEFGHELALLTVQNSTAGVIMLVKGEIADEVSYRVESDGVLIVEKPVSRPMFLHTLKMATAMYNRVVTLNNENRKLRKKLDEIRIIDRAKCYLIQHENLSEPQAHRYIEKLAMDKRKSKLQVANEMLEQYGQISS